MKRIMVVMGTRPEAIKLCPLVLEMRRRPTLSVSVCSGGQHGSMMDGVTEIFEVKPDFELKVMRSGQGVGETYAKILSGMGAVIARAKPELLVVQGDTSTAAAAAQAAFYRHVPIAHVEAGLRTYHIHSPFPEELHRRAIALMADYHFAPTVTASKNLIREGVNEKNVFITGNTVIDALRYTLSKRVEMPSLRIPKDKRLLIFTAHRREHLGNTLKGMFSALRRIVEAHPDTFAVCPLHPNPEVRRAASVVLEGCDRILCIEPPHVAQFHRLLSSAYLVLTDSGGIQEEAVALGIPTVVMRYSTERTEGIFAGNLRLSGSGEDGIVDTASLLLRPNSELYESMKRPSRVFGDGNASARIADLVEKI